MKVVFFLFINHEQKNGLYAKNMCIFYTLLQITEHCELGHGLSPSFGIFLNHVGENDIWINELLIKALYRCEKKLFSTSLYFWSTNRKMFGSDRQMNKFCSQNLMFLIAFNRACWSDTVDANRGGWEGMCVCSLCWLVSTN